MEGFFISIPLSIFKILNPHHSYGKIKNCRIGIGFSVVFIFLEDNH